MILYHGTIFGNEDFNNPKPRKNSYNRDGESIYLTTDISDAVANYATPYSADSRSKMHFMLYHNETTMSFNEMLARLFENHTPKVLTCDVSVNRPFVVSDARLQPHSPEYALDAGISDHLVQCGIMGPRCGDITKEIMKVIKRKKTTSEIITFLRESAANYVPYEMQDMIKGRKSFSDAIFSRFDAILDKKASDLWFVREGANHLILKDPSKIKVLEVKSITRTESEILRDHHMHPYGPHETVPHFDVEKQLNWPKNEYGIKRTHTSEFCP